MGEKLDPEAKRLRNVSSGELADAIGALEARVEVLKAEAIHYRVFSLSCHDRSRDRGNVHMATLVL
jgi:hypothetical protein